MLQNKFKVKSNSIKNSLRVDQKCFLPAKFCNQISTGEGRTLTNPWKILWCLVSVSACQGKVWQICGKLVATCCFEVQPINESSAKSILWKFSVGFLSLANCCLKLKFQPNNARVKSSCGKSLHYLIGPQNLPKCCMELIW